MAYAVWYFYLVNVIHVRGEAVRSRIDTVRQEAEKIAQEVYADPDNWRAKGINNVVRGFADFGRQHRGNAIPKLIAAYARLTVKNCPDHFRDAAGLPSTMKFRDIGNAFAQSHQTHLRPDSQIAKIHQDLGGDSSGSGLEGSLAYVIDDAHASIAYQEVLTAAYVGDEAWLDRASNAYATYPSFSTTTGYMTAILFLVYCRPLRLAGGK